MRAYWLLQQTFQCFSFYGNHPVPILSFLPISSLPDVGLWDPTGHLEARDPHLKRWLVLQYSSDGLLADSQRSQDPQTLLIFWWTKYVQSSSISVYSERMHTR